MEQFEKEVRMYDGKVFGCKISEYGKENGYLDYSTLSKIVGSCILNNDIISGTGVENWELIHGEEDCEVFQYYIISEYGYDILREYTDEIVYYNEDLGLYVWGVTHFGTSWDYVLTDIKLVEGAYKYERLATR